MTESHNQQHGGCSYITIEVTIHDIAFITLQPGKTRAVLFILLRRYKFNMNERGGYRCSFKGCQSASSEKRGTKETLFRFPKDIERSKLWVLACGREELFSKTATQLYNSYRVCKLYFAQPMFLNYERTRLQPHAVPNYIVTNNDQEASSSSSSSVETPCINSFNIKNTQGENTENIENVREEDTPLDMITFNERDVDMTHIDKAKISDSGTQTPLSLSSTSPRKVHLYQQIRGYKRKIASLEKEVQKAKKMKKEDIHTLDMLLEQYFLKQTSEFLKMQARLFQKNAKGRRYNDVSFKQHCLSIYFLSPKVYKDLANKSKLFCLPSCATLKRFTQNCYICTGLEENVFKILKIKTDNLPDINKYCICCIIDEMSLKSHLFYNITRDKVIGFEDIGCSQNNSQLPACNVAVIMVKGIYQSWKQPLCYFFLHSTMKASDLLKIIPEAVRKIKSIGLKLVGFTSDMGSNFYQLTRLLTLSPLSGLR